MLHIINQTNDREGALFILCPGIVWPQPFSSFN